MAYEGGRSMDMPKKNRPNSKAKVTARKAARKASGMSAQKFYVTTRMAEAAKSGKTLDRVALRKKFQSGEVTRKGFGAPKKKTGGTGSSSSGSSSSGSSSSGSSSTVKDSRRNPATKNMQGTKGYVPGKVQKSTKLPSTKSSSPKASGTSGKAPKMTPQEYWSTNYPIVPKPKK